MNILAIDFGTKRIGLAWMQSGVDVVLPFGVIADTSNKTRAKQLVDLIKEEKIDLLVVGLPVGVDGPKENFNTARVRAFVEEIRREVTIPIEFVDEAFTSAEADDMGGSASRDEKAAMLILQDYVSLKYKIVE